MSFSPAEIYSAFRQLPKAEKYYVALSGGRDSVCLLHSLVTYVSEFSEEDNLALSQIESIHVNHGLSANADAWADFCVQLCNQLGVVLHIERVDVVSGGKGVEAAARDARYQVFNDLVCEDEILLQGHHLDDQAETVLFRSMRGAGVSGLSAIPKERSLVKGRVYRPFLELPRSSISDYVKHNELTYCEDESNVDTSFDRNYIRHEVIPVLTRRWPDVNKSLSKVAAGAREAQLFIEEWCGEQYELLCSPVALSSSMSLSVDGLLSFSMVRQRMLVRYWLEQQAGQQPSEKIFERIWTELLASQTEAQPIICYSNIEIRRYKNALYCLSSSKLAEQGYQINISVKDLLGDGLALSGGMLRSKKVAIVDVSESKAGCVYICGLDSDTLISICSRKGGEKIYLREQHSSSLKKLYQEQALLPWLREQLPLIYLGDSLVASLAGIVASQYQSSVIKESSDLIEQTLLEVRFDPF